MKETISTSEEEQKENYRNFDDIQKAEGEIVYRDRIINNWETVFSAGVGRYGNIVSSLFKTPEGVYVHATSRPGEKTQLNDDTVTTAYKIKQVGEQVRTRLLSGEDGNVVFEDECREFITGDWTVYDAYWRRKTVSVSTITNEDAWPDLEEHKKAGKLDITFKLYLE